jgi:glucose-6-phosphate 1-dehydrogenase
VRAGKRLPEKTTEIAFFFKGVKQEKGHALFIRIQPDPGIFLQKIQKTSEDARSFVRLDEPAAKPASDAYEKIFTDSLRGDASLFVQADEQIASWRLWTPLLEHWKSHPPQFPNYSAGTWGPKAAEELTDWKVL